MAKSRKRQAPARSRTVSRKKEISSIVQFGVVFFFVAVLALVFYVAKYY